MCERFLIKLDNTKPRATFRHVLPSTAKCVRWRSQTACWVGWRGGTGRRGQGEGGGGAGARCGVGGGGHLTLTSPNTQEVKVSTLFNVDTTKHAVCTFSACRPIAFNKATHGHTDIIMKQEIDDSLKECE